MVWGGVDEWSLGCARDRIQCGHGEAPLFHVGAWGILKTKVKVPTLPQRTREGWGNLESASARFACRADECVRGYTIF